MSASQNTVSGVVSRVPSLKREGQRDKQYTPRDMGRDNGGTGNLKNLAFAALTRLGKRDSERDRNGTAPETAENSGTKSGTSRFSTDFQRGLTSGSRRGAVDADLGLDVTLDRADERGIILWLSENPPERADTDNCAACGAPLGGAGLPLAVRARGKKPQDARGNVWVCDTAGQCVEAYYSQRVAEAERALDRLTGDDRAAGTSEGEGR